MGHILIILSLLSVMHGRVEAKEIKPPTPIVVIDSGVDYHHPALRDHIDLDNAWNFNLDNDDVLDRPHQRTPQFVQVPPINQPGVSRFRQLVNAGSAILQNGAELLRYLIPVGAPGHGTHVSGIVLKECRYQCEIVPLKVFGEATLSIAHITQAVEYAVELEFPIINMSLGVFSKVIEESGSEIAMEQLEELIEVISKSTNTLFVVASGNDGLNLDEYDHKIIPAMISLDHVVTVGAVDDQGEIASFSNYGDRFVDLYAPGVNILSTWLDGGYREVSGTSMATPAVAARAALVLQEFPDLSPQELKIILVQDF